MKYYKDKEDYILVLEKGEELFKSLQKFVKKTNVIIAWVNALGACLEVELGYYNLDKKKYQWKTFIQTLEVTGLQGNIVGDDKNEPLFHIHGTFASNKYQVIGGHVNKLIVGGTLEILIQPNKNLLTRKYNGEVGLKLLSKR